MGQNQVILRHQKFTFPQAREWAKWASERTSERSGGRERSEQSGASEWVSSASEQANGRASGPVLQSVFLAVIDHSALFLRLLFLRLSSADARFSHRLFRALFVFFSFFCLRNFLFPFIWFQKHFSSLLFFSSSHVKVLIISAIISSRFTLLEINGV